MKNMKSQPGGPQPGGSAPSDPTTKPAGSPGSTKSSSSLTMSQLPVKQKKRLLEIEASRTWREFEKAQSIIERGLERQIGEAEVLVKQVTDAHHHVVIEVGGRAMPDLPPDLALRYRDTFSEVTLNSAKLEQLKKQLEALKEDVLEEHRRIQEELQEEKEKIDILFEDDNKLDAGDDALLKEFDRRHPDVGGANNPATTMNPSGPAGYEPRQRAPLNLGRRGADLHQQEYEYEREGQREGGATSLGVQELVAALGCAFGGTHGVEKKLPPFSGCPGEWLTFRSAYDMMNKPRTLQPSIMMRRLGEALKGDARTAVQHLLSNPDNLHKLMEVLERRFGRAEFVLDYLVDKVKSCKPADMKNLKTLIDFGTSVEALVENIKSYRKHDYLRDKSLQQQLVEKLPGPLKYKWHEYLMENDIQDVDLLELSFWLNKQVMIAERQVKPTIVESEPDKKREREPRRRTHGGIHGAAGDDDEPKNCLFCDKPKHSIDTCYSFKKKTVQERSEFVKSKGACFLCLVKGHMTTACKCKKKCEAKGCGKKHHTLLHRSKEPRKAEQQQQSNDEEDDIEDRTPATSPAENVIGAAASANILAVIPVKVKGPAGTKKVYAMLDLGASFSMIEDVVAAELGLTGVKEKLNYTVFGDKRSEDSLRTTVDVSGVMKKAEFYGIKTIHTVKKIGLPSRTFNAEEFKIQYPHLRNMKASSMRNAKPQMVIGINAGGLFAARQILELSPGEMPAAIRSLLGWYVVQDEDTMLKQFQYLCKCREKEEEMNLMMKNFFSTEAFGVQPCNMEGRSKDDFRALALLDENTTYDGSRWSSCLLWKDDDISLPPSKDMAMKRLISMEKKMDRDPDFARLCMEKFTDYKDKGYLQLRKEQRDHPRRWYLPWFFAIHPTKNPRLVFDAAAKVSGKCLNDYLLKGPDLLRPLAGVLIRFRRPLIGLTADIKEMFHQVKLKKDDRASQTVLFRGMDRHLPPKEYEMSVLFFGSASSPCSAIYAKDRNADQFEDKYPEAVKATKLDIYMDDELTGGDEVSQVITLRKQLSEIHQKGGFLLTKFNSSSPEVVKSIPPELRAKSTVSFNDKTEVKMEKTLGIYWDPVRDEFGFKVRLNKVPADVKNLSRLPTKREMASVIMSLFDPLGFVMPLKVKALCLMQEVWRQGTGWDQVINASLAEDWTSWMEEIPKVEEIRVPRKLSPVALKDCSSIELHCFVDASQDSFAAVSYLRIDTGGSAVTPFIMGKARVAPLRRISIPRMELQAAVMGARMVHFILTALNNEVKIDRKIFWSDSKTVMCWIRSTNGRFNVFVSNRIGELAELTNVNEWRWIPTKLNVADDPTRPSTVDLRSDSRWLTGPEFLLNDESKWPTEENQAKTTEEVRPEDLEMKIVCAAAEDTSGLRIGNILSPDGRKLQRLLNLSFPAPTQFSNWFRLIRATAQSVRAIRRFLRFRYGGSKQLTADDMKTAKCICILRAQREMFPDEAKLLEAGKSIGNRSRLYSLNPGLNEDGIIVHMGRIENARMKQEIKAPPILDPAHPYTKMMVTFFHEAGGHWGQERIMNELRRSVWILDARAAVRRAWARCLKCQIRRAAPRPPQMGQLPEARLDIKNPPFYHCGVDYFGPYEVKILRSTVKRYGVLFTCLTTRAVHLELAQSLDSNDFINCLARFISIRGKPAHLWSDNGKNFVGAEREIREVVQRLQDQGIQEMTMTKEIEFHFICPVSPHMGGSWERLIGSVKKILSSLVKEHHPKEDTLRTFLYEVMGIMNSRDRKSVV